MFFFRLLSGVNHTLQTSLTAALALDVDIIGNLLDRYENYFVLFCTFLGHAIPIIFMGVPRFWSHIKSTNKHMESVALHAAGEVECEIRCMCLLCSFLYAQLPDIYLHCGRMQVSKACWPIHCLCSPHFLTLLLATLQV